MLSGAVQFISGSARFKANNDWSCVAVGSSCSRSVANVDVIVGDMNVENFPSLMIFSGIFSSDVSEIPCISRLCFRMYYSESSIWFIAVLRSLVTPFRSSIRSAIFSSALRVVCLSELTSFLSALFSASKLSSLLM